MKFAIIHNNSGFGGIENQIKLLINGLSKEHTIFFFTRYPKCTLAQFFTLNPNVIVIPLMGGLINEYFQISREFRKRKIDVLQLHTFNNSVKYRFLKIFNRNVHVVCRVHTYIACSWIPLWKKKFYYLIDEITAPLVSKYILNGDYMLQEMTSNTYISRKKITNILDGTDTLLEQPKVDLSRINHLLMIANIIPHKGHNVLIHTINKLRSEGHNVYCDFLGATDRDIQYYKSLCKLIDEYDLNDYVKFLGFDKNIQKHLLEHSVVVLPSDSEGTPNCIMEAMSLKRLIIVSKTGGVAEFVEDSYSGFLHAPNDIDALAKILIKVMSMEKARLNEICCNAYDFWVKNLCSTAMCNKFLKVYEKL